MPRRAANPGCDTDIRSLSMSSDLLSSPTETTSGKWSARLTPERIKQLAECLIAGRTRKETAEALGVSESSVSRWKKDPRVLAEVERLRNRTGETRAVDVLLDLLDSDSDAVRLAAVKEIFRLKIQRAPEEPSPPDADEVVLPVEPGMRWVASVREEPFE